MIPKLLLLTIILVLWPVSWGFSQDSMWYDFNVREMARGWYLNKGESAKGHLTISFPSEIVFVLHLSKGFYGPPQLIIGLPPGSN